MGRILALLLSAAFGALLFSPIDARAAQSYDNCTGFISSVPAVITSQGYWCLDRDLSTSHNSTVAIDVRANNVTIDCNHFKLGGLAAGPSTNSTGIYAWGYNNITVQNCAIRGFYRGISIYGPGTGHLVEDNRLDYSTGEGIYVIGDGSLIQRNRVLNTGGRPGSDRASGITVLGDAVDNVVDGMHPAEGVVDFYPTGIYSGGVGNQNGVGLVIRNNRVRNLVSQGEGHVRGIVVAGTGLSVRDNVIAQPGLSTGLGVYCSYSAVVTGNVIRNFSQPMPSCEDGGGNSAY